MKVELPDRFAWVLVRCWGRMIRGEAHIKEASSEKIAGGLFVRVGRSSIRACYEKEVKAYGSSEGRKPNVIQVLKAKTRQRRGLREDGSYKAVRKKEEGGLHVQSRWQHLWRRRS
ncbi:hypothetical protein KP509_20G091800 [Ceratopteris richardii]|uniref:Uncharacterized protein n=1 Tax=Ceratopteris richardii TaxID=49495 RepID=A0A8T2SJ59_CERRI|nr:hypothetical protein KP509_20G091800 [Ceratopteris richardii]